ncbi:MAG TPA: hypothetical protein VK447_10165 [Myxococcaceae bacterium]|nr:hypothetical protein [Myxococcaceae bacterium]
MSDSQPGSAPTPEAGASGKREQATHVIGEILRLMGYPARLDVKDGADGGISVALQFEGEVPGVQVGKRSHLIDSLQFIVNKIVNRPTGERRWISIGVGQHPEPRPPPGERPAKKAAPAQAQVAQQVAQAPSAPAQAAVPAQAQVAQPPVAQAAAPAMAVAPVPAVAARKPSPPPAQARGPAQAPARRADGDELNLDVPEDSALSQAVVRLAQKSAELGRYYAITPMKPEDRARVLKSVAGVPGMKASVEGEGRNRRVVFTPDKPAPLPKRNAIPDYGDEDEDL